MGKKLQVLHKKTFMIPHVIHYCWFGGKALTPLAKKCINSWKKFFPDFEIKEWNEDNFNIEIIHYTKEAYKAKKYAFVSDFARYYILYKYGGLYFDTDVEVIKPYNDILGAGPFLGIEKTSTSTSVNPGLGMGAKPGMLFYKEMVDIFSGCQPVGSDEIRPILIKETTRIMKEQGWSGKNKLEKVNEITIYPNDYFNPLDDYTGKITITPETHSIHYYAKSWIEGYGPVRQWLSHRYHRLLKMLKR